MTHAEPPLPKLVTSARPGSIGGPHGCDLGWRLPGPRRRRCLSPVFGTSRYQARYSSRTLRLASFMSRLKMGFTAVLAAAAARGRPLAAILLNELPTPPLFNQRGRPQTEDLFSLAKAGRHAPKLHGWAGGWLWGSLVGQKASISGRRSAGGGCGCSPAKTQARAMEVVAVARWRRQGALGSQSGRWVAGVDGRVLLPGLAASSRRVARGARVVAPLGPLASQSCLGQLPGLGPRAPTWRRRPIMAPGVPLRRPGPSAAFLQLFFFFPINQLFRVAA